METTVVMFKNLLGKHSIFYLVILGSLLSCKETSKSKDMIVIAHRGASGYLPEHTLPAKALAYGMFPDFIEQDVVLSKDEVPVIIHDIYLETITNVAEVYPNRYREDGRYYVIDFTWEELKCLNVFERLDANTKTAVYPKRFPVGSSSFKLHRLEEEIEMIQALNRSMKKNIGVYVEIKEPKFHREHQKDISKIVLQTLKVYGYHTQQDACILQCFDALELKKIRNEYQSKLFLVQLLEIGYSDEAFRGKNALQIVKEIATYANGIGPWYKQLITGKYKENRLDNLVSYAHQQNLIVHAFTFRADDLEDKTSFEEVLQFAVDLQVDGIFTDHTDQAMAYFKKNH